MQKNDYAEKVKIEKKKIIIDDKPAQIISGGMNYFRIHPELWADRLDKAVAFGCNTVETYIAWNLHEPKRGKFNFTGIANLERFIDLAHERNLYVILRPGPYICAEWDNGGFPAWLNVIPDMQVRHMNKPYLEAVSAYYDFLLPKIKPKLYTNGGPIILMSIENEYGSFYHDKDYLNFLLELYRRYDIDVPFFTNDGPQHHHLLGGTLPETMVTMDFGSRSEAAWRNKEFYRPDSPDFCMEFWTGWFDHWGSKHHIRAAGAEKSAEYELEKMLAVGAHVNFYMFHGGTNFGFTNGANGNHFTDYTCTTTSYDYDAPLSECGDPTEKYYACQEVIKKYAANPHIRKIEPTHKIVPPQVGLDGSAELFDNLNKLSSVSGKSDVPPTMEDLGQSFGFIHYRKLIDGPLVNSKLRLYNVNDYAQVWLEGKYLGHRMRDDGQNAFKIEVSESGAVLDLLVENCGRINYGPYLCRDGKGITHAVTVEFQQQLYWEYNSLPLENPEQLEFGPFDNTPGKVRFHCGKFELNETGDTFLRRPGIKGSIWINGFHLGRYWDIGPSETLYIPAPILRCGSNHVIVMEQEGLDSDTLIFQDYPDLGTIE